VVVILLDEEMFCVLLASKMKLFIGNEPLFFGTMRWHRF